MQWPVVARGVAMVAVIVALSMVVPLAVAIGYGEPDVWSFAVALSAGAVPSALVLWSLRRSPQSMGRREALLIVSLSWAAAAFVGALPFYLYGRGGRAPAFQSFTACVFESISGFTTTGASVVADVESLPHGILLWRSAIQWLGGMGIIVLMVAALPMLGIGAHQLFQAEVPGPTKEKITPHLRDTARQLWLAYVALSGAEVLALLFAGMGPFDAICHTFTTMATGGFSTKSAGVMAFDSVAIEVVLTSFMVLAGLNFALHVRLLRGGEWRPLLRDAESRIYVAILVGLTALVTLGLWMGGVTGPANALRHASFQIVSLMTTTGYASADFDAWSVGAPLVPVLLLVAMVVGGCSGSTAGAVKVSRVIVAFKHAWRELGRMAHPRAVIPVRVGGMVVAESVVARVSAFLTLYAIAFVVGVAAVALSGQDLVTSLSAVAATLGNVGPGLGRVGPTLTYAEIHPVAQWVLMGEMLLGRLELLTVLAVGSRIFWRR